MSTDTNVITSDAGSNATTTSCVNKTNSKRGGNSRLFVDKARPKPSAFHDLHIKSHSNVR